MNIASMRPISLIDFPGHIATVLFTPGCNFRCAYCHNKELLSYTGALLPEPSVLETLCEHKKIADAVSITGGEPTLQPGLENFLEKLRQGGWKIKLDTNGSNPDVLWKLINKKLIDFIAMDVKCSYMFPGRYEGVTGYGNTNNIHASVRALMTSGVDYEFRTTVFRGIVDEDLYAIGSCIKGAKTWALQHCRDPQTGETYIYEKDTERFGHTFEKIAAQYAKALIVR
jgi:pyruvate formate lyase activating enzyme